MRKPSVKCPFFTAMICISLVVSACATLENLRTVPVIELEEGALIHYSSATGDLTYDNCRTQPPRVILSRSELMALGEEAQSSGFFQLPDQFDGFGFVGTDGRVDVNAEAIHLKISWGSMSNRVYWYPKDADNGGGVDPKQISTLVAHIRNDVFENQGTKTFNETNDDRGNCWKSR